MALLLDKRTDGRGNGILATDLAIQIEAVKRDLGFDDDDGSFDIAKSRRWLELFARKATQRNPIMEVTAHDESVSVAGGTITNRIYNTGVIDLTVLFVHGGGWVIGSIDTHDQVARWIAAQTGARVISIGYSLAPEHPFPRAIEDCREVFEKTLFASKNARIFVVGDSAGATIAAMAILRLEAAQKKRISGFVSIYGAYSPEMNLSSHRLYGDGRFGLSEAQMRWFWNLYAPQLAPSDRDKLTPIAADLSGFPSTLCIGAECDLLLDDTLALYSRLAGSAVDVTLSLWPNLPHGCMHFVGVVDSVTEVAGTIVQFIAAHGRTTLATAANAPALLQGKAPRPGGEGQDSTLINVEPLFLTSCSRSHGTLAHKIAKQIITGQLAPGALLPNEEKASASFGVSRSAYREAMRTLAAKGLVVALPKVGTKISSRANWQLLDPDVLAWHFEAGPDEAFVRDLFELRSAVQPKAASLAALRRNEQDISDLADALARMARTNPTSGGWLSAVVSFHQTILLASKNAAIASLWPVIGTNIRWSMKLQMMLPSLKLVRDPVADHARVFETVASQNASEAARAMEMLIEATLIDNLENLKRANDALQPSN